MKVAITRAAQTDITAIRQYISADSPRAGERVVSRLIRACRLLSDLPSRGRPGKLAGTREITTVWPYVVVYRVTSSTVEVLRVWHGAQDRG